MKLFRFVSIILMTSIFTNCASGYKPANLNSFNYPFTSAEDGIILKYQYGFLNNKYSNKEEKKGIKMIAVHITNTTDEEIVIGKDVHFMLDNGQKAIILGPENAFSDLKQRPAGHLLYLLLSPINLFITRNSGNRIETNRIPIGLVLGPGLAAGNMITAGSANKKLKEQLYNHYIVGMTVFPGKELKGIICIKSNSLQGIKIVKSQ